MPPSLLTISFTDKYCFFFLKKQNVFTRAKPSTPHHVTSIPIISKCLHICRCKPIFAANYSGTGKIVHGMPSEPITRATQQETPLNNGASLPGNGLFLLCPTLPWIREARFGNTLGARSKAMENLANHGPLIGPLDLVHWGRHYGDKSNIFLHNAFEEKSGILHSKEEDGYVGYFHFVNGIDYAQGAARIEAYLMGAVGLEEKNGAYFWLPSVDVSSLGVYHEKQMVVTLCSYNIFARSELRARFLVSVPKSRKSAVPVDALYSIYCHVLKKQHTYNKEGISDVRRSFWHELAALTLTRLCLQTDDKARQLCGTANLPEQVSCAAQIHQAMGRLVSLLNKGHLAGHRALYGSASTCGADFVKTTKYRNHVIDALVRVVALDASGKTAQTAVDRIRKNYANDFDYVVARVLKADAGNNNDLRFLQLVHGNLTSPKRKHLCQNALLLIEQARFLLARQAFETATHIAAEAVSLLPLDFDAWYTLALSYAMNGDFARALETINAFPLTFSKENLADLTGVDGVYDSFAMTYKERAAHNKALDLHTFETFFPAPKKTKSTKSTKSANPTKSAKPKKPTDLASMGSLWHEQFVAQRHLRHPICGPFYSSPLSFTTSIELSAVDQRVNRVAGPGAAKLTLAAQLAGNPWASIIDFECKSTWGRTYDLVTLMVALAGWDQLVHIKNKTFRDTFGETGPANLATGSSNEFVVDRQTLQNSDVKLWLQQLFLVIYEDIRLMVQMLNQDQDRSALSWGMIGLIGWACKSNLKDNLSAIHTSISGVSADSGFDYYGTVKMLEIYNEFILSDVAPSSIDPLSSVYDDRQYTNKLIVQTSSEKVYREFVRQLQNGYFSLENILLCLARLVSWNVRWYDYMPSSLVTDTLIKLCTKYDALVVRSRLEMLMKSLVKKKAKKPPPTFTLRGMFAAPLDEQTFHHEFVEGDTIIEYMEQLLGWIEHIADSSI